MASPGVRVGWSESAELRRNPADSNPTLLGSSVDQHTEPSPDYSASSVTLSIEEAWSRAVAWSIDTTLRIDDLVAEAVARCGGRSRLAEGDETECWNAFSRIYGRLVAHHGPDSGPGKNRVPDVERHDAAVDLGLGRTTGTAMPSRATSPPGGFASLRAILHPESDTLGM